MNRKEAREWIVKYLFYYSFQPDDYMDSKTFADHYALSGDEIKYFEESTNGIITHLDSIDEYIGDFLHNWTQDRIPKLDLAILRMSIYELMYTKDVPESVTINEAVEIAKKYSTEDSFRYINGVLGAFVRRNKNNASN